MKGFAAGSINSENILYCFDRVLKTKLHVPGLVKKNDQLRNTKWARYPYYKPTNTPISEADEVVAFAVLLSECLLADCYQWRETWRAIVSHPPSYDSDPKKLLLSLIRDLEGNEVASSELLNCIRGVAHG